MQIDENVLFTGQIRQQIVGNTDADPSYVIGGHRQVINDGTGTRPTGNGGYRQDYTTRATRCGFDVGHVFITIVESSTADGGYEGEWHVGVSPADPGGPWTFFTAEINIGSRVDSGYQETINGPRPTGGHLFVPTVPTALGPPGSSKNATFAVAIAGGPNVPYMAQFYNGFLINPDSIAKGGRGIQFGGANLAENAPYAPFEVTRSWESGLRLEKAAFKDGKAVTLAPTQKIAWTDGTEAVHLTPRQIKKLRRILEQ